MINTVLQNMIKLFLLITILCQPLYAQKAEILDDTELGKSLTKMLVVQPEIKGEHLFFHLINISKHKLAIGQHTVHVKAENICKDGSKMSCGGKQVNKLSDLTYKGLTPYADMHNLKQPFVIKDIDVKHRDLVYIISDYKEIQKLFKSYMLIVTFGIKLPDAKDYKSFKIKFTVEP